MMKGETFKRMLFMFLIMFLFPSLCSGNIITTVDPYGNVGWFTSIAIGSDNLPVISYQDRFAGNLMVAKCDDAACTSATRTIVDFEGNVGSDTSIAIGWDGNPIISYLDASNYYLKVAKCGNESCTSDNIITTLEGTGIVPSLTKTSITIGVDHLPIISYCYFTNYNLRVAKCNDAACTWATITTVDSSPGYQGWYSSIAIGADGLPIISHGKSGLQVAKCGNNYCTSGNTLTTVDPGINAWDTSIAIGQDDLPIISYYDYTYVSPFNLKDLKVAKCNDAACTSATITTIDSEGDVGQHSSIAIGTDGLPVISYYGNGNLKVAKCGNASCTSGNIISTVDSAVNVGWYTSIAIGSDGLPIISYYDAINKDLKVLKCSTQSCFQFNDVQPGYWAYDYVYAIYNAGITSGCGGQNFCPEDVVTRAQMAVFILKALGEPPADTCTGTVFNDVNASTVGDGFCKYIEKFSTLGITGGCGGGNYCPNNPVTRAEMGVFITKALQESPVDTCTGTVFSDVNASTVGEGFCKYIEKFSTLGITGGCGGGNYCPFNNVTRAQMAVFLTKAFLQ